MKPSKRLGLALFLALAASLLLSGMVTAPLSASAAGDNEETTWNHSSKQVVGYFIEWGVYGRQYFVKNVVSSGSATKLTTLNYAFANVTNNQCALFDPYADYDMYFDATKSVDGVADSWDTGALRGNFHQLQKLKALYPNLKVLISVGGWTGSAGFSQAAQPANVQSFVSSCISTFLTDSRWAGLFDGFDIDWEYPAACGAQCGPAEDTKNFTGLLAEFRRQLDALHPGLLLTIAAPAGSDKYSKIELNKVQKYVNWLDLMAYDFHIATEPATNFQSPLFPSPLDPTRAKHYDTDEVVNAYVRAGVPPRKIVLGVPFYGRGWQGVPAKNNGIYQPATGPAAGTWEAGIEDYHTLKNLESSGRYFDPITQSAYLYNPSTGVFWSYENPFSLTIRGLYIDSKFGGLGGGMFWELSGDDSQGSLITALYNSTRVYTSKR